MRLPEVTTTLQNQGDQHRSPPWHSPCCRNKPKPNQNSQGVCIRQSAIQRLTMKSKTGQTYERGIGRREPAQYGEFGFAINTMTSLFNNSNDHHLQTEPISIGCEAWIDVVRFCAAEKPAHHTTKTPTGTSLTRSFTDIRRKFQKSSDGDID